MPGVVLPLSALTAKDRADLAFALELGVDWVALSFVQRPEDVDRGAGADRRPRRRRGQAREAGGDRAARRDRRLSDAVMVARGDLGVEMPAEQVPAIQKRIVRACRGAASR